MALYVRKGTRIVGFGAAHSWWISELCVLRSWKTSSAVLLLSFASLQPSRAQVPPRETDGDQSYCSSQGYVSSS